MIALPVDRAQQKAAGKILAFLCKQAPKVKAGQQTFTAPVGTWNLICLFLEQIAKAEQCTTKPTPST